MARTEPKSPPAAHGWRSRLRFRPRVWLSLLCLLGLGLTANYAWQRGRSMLAAHPQYQLTADSIHITPPPAWIRSDIKSQALRHSNLLTNASLLDDWPELSQKVGGAFQAHPWVESVERITRKLPAALEIELKYRTPIAAVESRGANGVVFLPLDAHAVRLPEGDLTEAECRRLPRIAGIEGQPLVGEVWNDARIVGGAKLIASLGNDWHKLRLMEVLPRPVGQRADEVCTFDIITMGGTRIIWGAEPGQESTGRESSFGEKRQRLLNYAAQHGRLESIDGPAVIDLRTDLIITPRTAKAKSKSKNQ